MPDSSLTDTVTNRYHCPRCDAAWQERADSACDSECPDCGLGGLTPALTIND